MNKKIWTIFSLVFVSMVCAGAAFALTDTPAAGDFAFELYDIVSHSILGGPIGIIAGIGCLVAGGVMAVQQKILGAVPCLLGGVIILQADTMIQSLGMLV